MNQARIVHLRSCPQIKYKKKDKDVANSISRMCCKQQLMSCLSVCRYVLSGSKFVGDTKAFCMSCPRGGKNSFVGAAGVSLLPAQGLSLVSLVLVLSLGPGFLGLAVKQLIVFERN